jgi:hypothetical protein
METTTCIQLSTLPNYIKKGSLYQELQKSQSTGDDAWDGSNGSVASADCNDNVYDNPRKRPCCVRKDGPGYAASNSIVSTSTSSSTTTVTWVEEPYLSFPAQYCRFDAAEALASTTPPRSKAAVAVEVAVEPGSIAAAAATAASALSPPAFPASVLGAVGVMSTLRYWGVEDELPLELVRYLLESEALSLPSSSLSSSLLSSSSSMALPGVDTNIDAGTTNTAVGETACIVHVQGTTTTTSAAAASAPPNLLGVVSLVLY